MLSIDALSIFAMALSKFSDYSAILQFCKHFVMNMYTYVFMLQEQTIEREQERDDYQTKIDKLELLLKDKQRQGNTHSRLTYEVGSVL